MQKLIFTTNSNPGLVRKVAAKTNMRLGKALVKKFADQEISVLIKEKVKNKNVYVLGSSFPPADNLLELLILINTLKVNGAKKIITIIPYFGYSKADHITPPGASLAGKLMVQAVELAGASQVMAVNPHSKHVEKFFKVPLVHLSAIPLLAGYFKKINIKNLAVISPDLGGVARAKEFAQELGISKIITVKKYRPGFDQAKILKILGEVKNKNVIIVDDMIQSGSTIIKAAKALKRQGANNIYIAVVHLVFTGPSVSVLAKEKSIKQIVITDTIPSNVKLPAKFKVISIDRLIVEAIR